jgi:flagellar hook assembly protein FlgD
VRLAIYDVSGRNVATLSDEIQEAGTYSREWDGHDAGGQRLPSGVYFARLEFGARVTAQKIVLTR